MRNTREQALLFQSYLDSITLDPTINKLIEDLSVFLIEEKNVNGQTIIINVCELTYCVQDIFQKFGFLLLSRQYLEELIPKFPVYVKYHIYNFIVYSKSLLDAFSVLLNNEYFLGFVGGEIDLKLGSFKSEIGKKNEHLSENIIKFQSWIDEVVEYRNNLIHRHYMTVTMCGDKLPSLPPGPHWDKYELMIGWNPNLSPKDYFYENKQNATKKQFGALYRKIMELCNEWINQSEEILILILNDLLQNLKNGRLIIK